MECSLLGRHSLLPWFFFSWALGFSPDTKATDGFPLDTYCSLGTMVVLRDLESLHEAREDPIGMPIETYVEENFGTIYCTEESRGYWVHMSSGDPQIRGGSISYLIDKRDGSILRRVFGR